MADKASIQLHSIALMIENDLPEDVEIFADPMVMKILYNLMENSIRHGKTSTHFRFLAEERFGDLIIICEDNGVGIPEESKEKIFER
ncbi:MAG: sensor histidine kinase [Methanospirillum sp.]|uniref:sensor histidine kinase n=1 Tax=Methanospirillum sp. TaxID=45200 RepID=UPI0023763818|nr:sensor histidine kinase [Methanospirillum sp.]MDD1727472.1 sensor histidine kinase [Methanospirillum sp.]